MLGLFFEMGPVTLNETGDLVPRKLEHTWASKMPVVFVDSPVGTGWSFAKNDSSYAKDENDVARDLSAFLTEFAKIHPEAPTSLVLSSESYGGHYLPALGNYLREHKFPHTVEGITIGDGLTDPVSQVMTKPDLAYEFGLIDEEQRGKAQAYALQARDAIQKGDFSGAADFRGQMEDVVSKASAVNLYDIRTTVQYDWQDERMKAFFGKASTKDMLHIPQQYSFGTNDAVGKCLNNDIMRSQKPHVEKLLAAGTRMLLYQGQFDWKDGVASNEAWITKLKWYGAGKFLTAPRAIWKLSDGSPAGYWRGYENLDQVTVLGAGHLVPMNAPAAAIDMIMRFINKQRPSAVAPTDHDIVV
jgi:vitellogenic carboxypeptidase-like protein